MKKSKNKFFDINQYIKDISYFFGKNEPKSQNINVTFGNIKSKQKSIDNERFKERINKRETTYFLR